MKEKQADYLFTAKDNKSLFKSVFGKGLFRANLVRLVLNGIYYSKRRL
jgi:hypothetical protein